MGFKHEIAILEWFAWSFLAGFMVITGIAILTFLFGGLR